MVSEAVFALALMGAGCVHADLGAVAEVCADFFTLVDVDAGVSIKGKAIEALAADGVGRVIAFDADTVVDLASEAGAGVGFVVATGKGRRAEDEGDERLGERAGTHSELPVVWEMKEFMGAFGARLPRSARSVANGFESGRPPLYKRGKLCVLWLLLDVRKPSG